LNNKYSDYKLNDIIELYVIETNNTYNYNPLLVYNSHISINNPALLLSMKDYKMYTTMIKFKNLDEEKQMILMWKIIEKLNINIDDL